MVIELVFLSQIAVLKENPQGFDVVAVRNCVECELE